MLSCNVQLKFTTQEQESHWFRLLSETTAAYNDIAQMIVDNKCPLSLKPVHALVYQPMREKYPFLPAQAVIKTYKDVIGNMKVCKKRDVAPVRTRLSMHLDARLYSNLTPIGVRLATERKNYRANVEFVTYPRFAELASRYRMCDPSIFYRDGKFYLTVVFDVPKLQEKDDTRLGVDLGMRRLFTTSDGVAFKGATYKAAKRKIRFQKRQLQAKGTKNAKRKLRQIRHRERNINKQMVHEVANRILKTDKSVIVMEDLTGIKQKTTKTKDGFKRKRHNNAISQIPFYMLRMVLTYKAAHAGKRVTTVSPSYTSQTNSLTGKKEGSRHGCRFSTPNGLMLDADWNAAINIRERYAREHSTPHTVPLDGALCFVDRPQSTGQMSPKRPNGSLESQAAESLVRQ